MRTRCRAKRQPIERSRHADTMLTTMNEVRLRQPTALIVNETLNAPTLTGAERRPVIRPTTVYFKSRPRPHCSRHIPRRHARVQPPPTCD